MLYLTREILELIREYLAKTGIRDWEFPEVLNTKDEDYITLILDNKNRKIKLSLVVQAIIGLIPKDTVALEAFNALSRDFASLKTSVGTLGNLLTTDKSTIVAAINELIAKFDDKPNGIYIGSGTMPDGYSIQIDPNGEVLEFDEAPTLGSHNLIESGAVYTALSSLESKFGVLGPEITTLMYTDNISAGLRVTAPYGNSHIYAEDDGLFLETSGLLLVHIGSTAGIILSTVGSSNPNIRLLIVLTSTSATLNGKAIITSDALLALQTEIATLQSTVQLLQENMSSLGISYPDEVSVENGVLTISGALIKEGKLYLTSGTIKNNKLYL